MFKHCYRVQFERMRAGKKKVGFSGFVQRASCLVPADRYHAGSGNETGRWCFTFVQFHFIKSQKGTKIEWMNERMNEWMNGWMNEWMNEWMRIYISHISHHVSWRFKMLLSEIGRQLVKEPLAATISPYLITQPPNPCMTRDRPQHRELQALLFSISVWVFNVPC